jgi:hypothetical protein
MYTHNVIIYTSQIQILRTTIFITVIQTRHNICKPMVLHIGDSFIINVTLILPIKHYNTQYFRINITKLSSNHSFENLLKIIWFCIHNIPLFNTIRKRIALLSFLHFLSSHSIHQTLYSLQHLALTHEAKETLFAKLFAGGFPRAQWGFALPLSKRQQPQARKDSPLTYFHHCAPKLSLQTPCFCYSEVPQSEHGCQADGRGLWLLGRPWLGRIVASVLKLPSG